jgi:uncharacterized protein
VPHPETKLYPKVRDPRHPKNDFWQMDNTPGRTAVTLERIPSRRKIGEPEGAASDRNPERALGAGQTSAEINFAGLCLTLDPSGAAYIAAQHALIVSDLHLEKGSGAAARGRLIPALDSYDTLLRLKRAIKAYEPKRVICLGDSFHDRFAGDRMAEADRTALNSLCNLAQELVWVSGNHDPEAPAFCEGERKDQLEIGGITLRHEPDFENDGPQIIGHFHPKTSVAAGGYRFSGRCFYASDEFLIMPAFGAFTGGLSCADSAIASLHKSKARIFMMHAAKIWRVA